jgi:REP element-mobilizing transposase RayT
VDRYWLLTWTTYATWMPGDRRGFIGRDRVPDGGQRWRNVPGTPTRDPDARLELAARARRVGESVWLTPAQAGEILDDLRHTADVRGWELHGVAVMRNHVHLVVGVTGDPDPATLLRDFKAYASRALNQRWARPASGTWWTQSGSRRILRDEPAVIAAVNCVREQPGALAVWVAEDWR